MVDGGDWLILFALQFMNQWLGNHLGDSWLIIRPQIALDALNNRARSRAAVAYIILNYLLLVTINGRQNVTCECDLAPIAEQKASLSKHHSTVPINSDGVVTI